MTRSLESPFFVVKTRMSSASRVTPPPEEPSQIAPSGDSAIAMNRSVGSPSATVKTLSVPSGDTRVSPPPIAAIQMFPCRSSRNARTS